MADARGKRHAHSPPDLGDGVSPTGTHDGLSLAEASRLAGDVARYEEGLTARTVGLTLMAWGPLTFGLFFLSYAVAAGGSDVPFSIGLPVMLLVVLAGIGFTNQLWRSRALSARVGFRPAAIWGQGLALLIVGLAAMVWVDDLVLTGSDSSVSLAFVATFLLGYLGLRLLRSPWQRTPWVLIGAVALAVVDVVLVIWAPDRLPEPDGRTHLMAAAATALAVYVPGYLYFRQG